MKFNLFISLGFVMFCLLESHAQDPTQGMTDLMYLKDNSPIHTKWKSIGPEMNSARVEAVQGIPDRPGHFYVAFGSGNLWRTTNNGITWDPLFDNQPVQGIGDIAIAPANPNIIYLGSGESLRKQRNFTMPGNGMYRSDDGGDSWRHIGLDSSWHIGEIAVHPTDPDVVLVAVMGKFWTPSTAKGIYRTSDGGQSWQKVLYVNETCRANDVVYAPSNPDIVYATMWDNHPDTSLFESVAGPASGVYKSSDGGLSWEKYADGLPQGDRTGRMGIAVSHQNPEKAYVSVDNLNKAERIQAGEIYRTDNGGKNWIRTHEKNMSFSSVIGWYFADIYVNPDDDEEIYALGVRLIRSSDGGATFEMIGGHVEHVRESAAQTLHLDHCELWIDPNNSNHLILGNDGGVFQSFDRGAHWRHHNNIASGEFYTITVEQQSPHRIFGGTQDNSTVVGIPSNTGYRWSYLWIDPWSGGDGCVTQIDWQDPNTIYFSAQEGATRRFNRLTNESKGIRPKLEKGSKDQLVFNFVTPYTLSHYNPRHIYQAGNFVFKSDNRGDSWAPISPNLSKVERTAHIPSAAGAIAESPLKQGTLLVGMDDGRVWITEDDGQTWVERSEGLANRYIRSMVSSRYDFETVYTCMTGLNDDDFQAYIYKSDDLGQNWSSIKGNLPNQPVNVIVEDPFYSNVIYAGTHRGVFCSADQGANWMLLGDDIPDVSIADLSIIRDRKILIAATHGRGIYSLDLNPLYEVIENNLFDDSANALEIISITEITAPKTRTTHKDVELSSLVPLDIHFWSSTDDDVSLQISTTDSLVWSTNIAADRGLNHFQWDLVYRTNQSDHPYFIKYKEYIESGEYQCLITSSNEKDSKGFFVKSE